MARLILSHTGHMSSQDLVTRVQAEHPGIGVATVYRNIKVLCDAKILKESLTLESGVTVYELYEDAHHDHIVCLDCGEIFEFHNEVIEATQQTVAQNLEMIPVNHKHVIYARCARIHRNNT